MKESDVEAQQVSAEVAQTMLAPSNAAAALCPDLDPAEAADRYVTSGTERVPEQVLRDALVFLEYANASYYIEVSALVAVGAVERGVQAS